MRYQQSCSWFAADGQCSVEQGAHSPSCEPVTHPERSYSCCSICHTSNKEMNTPVLTNYSGVPYVDRCSWGGSHITPFCCLFFCPGLKCCTQQRPGSFVHLPANTPLSLPLNIPPRAKIHKERMHSPYPPNLLLLLIPLNQHF